MPLGWTPAGGPTRRGWLRRWRRWAFTISAKRAVSSTQPEELRGWEWRHLQGRLDQSLAVVAGRSGKTSIAFCPPGRRVAVADGRSDYRLLDAVTGESLDVRGTDTPDSPCRQVFAFSTSAGPRFVVDQSAKGLSLYLADGSGAALSRIGLTDPSHRDSALALCDGDEPRRPPARAADTSLQPTPPG